MSKVESPPQHDYRSRNNYNALIVKLGCRVVVCLIVIEMIVRASGIVSVPLYDVDSQIGYVPRAHQEGEFLHRNDWYFNDKSMPVPRNWEPSAHPNILLIGNSIIMGGNPFRQEEKLAPLLQRLVGSEISIWPVAVGGWTQINEMVYLDRHPEIVRSSSWFLWEYMSGGLSGATQWRGEYTFPTHQPIYATWYAIRRYLISKLFPDLAANELPVVGSPNEQNVLAFEKHVESLKRSTDKKVAGVIWLYPTKAELEAARRGIDWLPERRVFEKVAREYDIKIIDIGSNLLWSEELYRADGVHPTIQGNHILATILGEEINESIEPHLFVPP